MKTLLTFFSFLPGAGVLNPSSPRPSGSVFFPSSTCLPYSGVAPDTPTLGHCLGKQWGAGTADYISHHAQHCGPH